MQEPTKTPSLQAIDGPETIASPTEPPVHYASALTNGGSRAFICHWDHVYRLKINESGHLELLK